MMNSNTTGSLPFINIFDIINNGDRGQDEEMTRKRVHADLNMLIKDFGIAELRIH